MLKDIPAGTGLMCHPTAGHPPMVTCITIGAHEGISTHTQEATGQIAPMGRENTRLHSLVLAHLSVIPFGMTIK